MAREPVESSQCCVSHEPTRAGVKAADDSAGGTGDFGGVDDVPAQAARGHRVSTAAATATEPLRPPARARLDVDSLITPDRGCLAPP